MLTFIVGTAADVFGVELARRIEEALHVRFDAYPDSDLADSYQSEPVNARGWRALQARALQLFDPLPQLTGIDAYQAVYLPVATEGVEYLPIATLADPLQAGSLEVLFGELRQFAAKTSLPTDDLELMGLAAHYLEHDDPDADLDVQTFVQLMLSVRQALARRQPLWIAV